MKILFLLTLLSVNAFADPKACKDALNKEPKEPKSTPIREPREVKLNEHVHERFVPDRIERSVKELDSVLEYTEQFK